MVSCRVIADQASLILHNITGRKYKLTVSQSLSVATGTQSKRGGQMRLPEHSAPVLGDQFNQQGSQAQISASEL